LLDSFGGTLLVISHDRYFLERVCDTFVGLVGDKSLRDLPRGIDEYLQLRKSGSAAVSKAIGEKKESSILEQKALKKELARLEKQMERRQARIAEIAVELAAVTTDHTKLSALHAEQESLEREYEELEMTWLELNVS